MEEITIKRKEILFISPTSPSIYKVILKGFEEYAADCNVTFMSNTYPTFFYKNKIHRIQNFVLKTFLKKNLKKIFSDKIKEKRFAQLLSKYDQIIVIRPDLFSNEDLQKLKEKTDCLTAYYWDSVAFYSRKGDIIPFFDKIFSFDLNDCEKYNLRFLSNFFYFETTNEKLEGNVLCVSHLEKKRFELFNKMGAYFMENDIDFRFLTKQSVNKLQSPYIEYLGNLIPYEELLVLESKYSTILDIAKPKQAGLSFRIFEGLGMNKKVITNNKTVLEYDFYNPNNICVVDFDNLQIPMDFFQTPVVVLPDSIKRKYHLESFISTIVSK